ncbi:prolyl oligopeptidase family serine peptidase [Massilia sp. CF038]|uniref:carboxylesterase family protein n=1 Tax=Massilia sp. CF038 TaxID=1881045 RepID=UPI000913C84F|nr:prolyl oligopeptidase family serine peptidase [Massilia sp. CF038]SHH71285.1 Putative esterase [Massilia sp. CF038]
MQRRSLLALTGLALGVALALPAAARTRAQALTSTFRSQLRYLAFLPTSYSRRGPASPLILFLHGSGERGSDLDKVKAWGPPAIADKDPDFPFIVIAPQLPEGESWDALALKHLLDDVLKKYQVDRDRVYLTGLSLGGYGAWDLAARYPQYFAALAPICGGGIVRTVGSLRALPTWVFHGQKDEAVPEEESARMVAALKAAGGNVQYTVLPEGGHVDAWVHAYDKAGLFEWFLKQRR